MNLKTDENTAAIMNTDSNSVSNPAPINTTMPGYDPALSAVRAFTSKPPKIKVFNHDKFDFLFSLIYFALGYIFTYILISNHHYSMTSAFTVIYAAVVLLYCYSKKIKPAKESWFWLIIMLTIGVPYYFWSILSIFQFLMLIIVAAYWTLCITGNLLCGGMTSSCLITDVFNSLCVVPFSNMDAQLRIVFTNLKKTKQGLLLTQIFIGLLISIPVLLIILPKLASADLRFDGIMEQMLNYIESNFMTIIFRFVLSLPVSLFLFGLIYGGIHKRNTSVYKYSELRKNADHLRKLPNGIILTPLFLICIFYGIFIALQGDYLFMAFRGILPENLTYAEYARQGFFELCQIAGFNAAFLTIANIFARDQHEHNLFLKIMNIILSVLTLLLIATAMSKMVLYISVYHFTAKRIIASMFMIWMTTIFIMTILWQKKKFPIFKWCIFSGAICFSLLCIIPFEWWL